MDTSTYLAAINAAGIDHRKVQWASTVKPAAAHKAHNLRKVTTALVMTGAAYDQIGEVSQMLEQEQREAGSLPWGEWSQFPHIITHKDADYARLYVIDGTVKTVYMVDGDPVDRDTFNGYLTPSQRDAKRPVGGTVTVKMENIKIVH